MECNPLKRQLSKHLHKSLSVVLFASVMIVIGDVCIPMCNICSLNHHKYKRILYVVFTSSSEHIEAIASHYTVWQLTDLCYYRVTQAALGRLGTQDPPARMAFLAWMVVTATLGNLDPLVRWVLLAQQDPLDLQAPWDQQDPKEKE